MSNSNQQLNKTIQKSWILSKHYKLIILFDYNEYIQEKVSEQTKTKLGVAGLVALPVAAAMYSSGSIALEQVS